jgi:hypothetical protein
MGEGRPEPIHLYTQHVADGLVRVVHSDGSLLLESTSLDFVSDAIKELKLRGHDHETSVIIEGVSGNPAFNGALKHHGA